MNWDGLVVFITWCVCAVALVGLGLWWQGGLEDD